MKHTITLTHQKWQKLKEQIAGDYGRAAVLVSWRTKAMLGFTVREHRDYQSDASWDQENTIRLDFYDEQLQTLFLLKYSEFLQLHEN